MAQVLADLTPRLEAAAIAVRDAERAYRLQVQLRDELIVTAVDEGMHQRAVAKAAGITTGRITPILARAHADED